MRLHFYHENNSALSSLANLRRITHAIERSRQQLVSLLIARKKLHTYQFGEPLVTHSNLLHRTLVLVLGGWQLIGS